MVRKIMLVGLITSAAAIPATAFAQGADDQGAQLEEIIVTATKREENLQKVPVTVSALAGEALEARGIINPSDIARAVPNLQVTSGFGDVQPNFTLRGVSVGNEYNSNQASPIGVYVDEVYQSSRVAHGAQLYDVERVEVVKGPQGTLYGRNTTGGAINIITRKPSLNGVGGYITGKYGNLDRWTLQGALDATLAEDVAGLRIAFTRSKGDGYMRNVLGGPALSSTDNYGVRGILTVKPTDGLELSIKGYTAKSDPWADGNISIGSLPGGVDILGQSRAALGLNRREVAADQVGKFTTKASGGAFTLNWDLGGATLTSISGYDETTLDLIHDPDGLSADNLYINWFAKSKQFNQDLRISIDSVDRLKAIVGAYYGWDRNRTLNSYGFFRALRAVQPNFNPPLGPGGTGLIDPLAPISGLTVVQGFRQTRTSYAVYGEGTYELTDKLSLTLGARFTKDKARYEDGQAFFGDYDFNPVIGTVPANFPFNPNAFQPAVRGSSDRLTGRVILDYKFTDDVLAYASYSRGYRSGAFNGQGYIDASQIYFVPPETIDSGEVGLKSRFLDNRVQFNAALFYSKYKNQQTVEIVGAVGFLRSAPKAIIYGLDAELNAVLTDGLSVNAGLGLLHSEYQNFSLSGVDLSGNQLIAAPKVTFNAGFDWTVADLGIGKLSLLGDASYRSRSWFSPFNGGPAFVGDTVTDKNLGQEGYWLANGRISLTGDNYTLSLWGKNLFDKFAYVYGNNLRGFFGFDYLVRNEPRTYGVEVQFRF